MLQPLHLCIIGCGRVASSHAEGALQIPETVQLTAIVSRNDEKRSAFKEKFHVKYDFADLDEALSSGTFDAVDICVPNDIHSEYTIRCTAAKKHILLEKPMANTVAECIKMNEAAKKNGVKLMVGQSRRYHDAVMRSRKMLEDGAIGELLNITATLMGYLPAPPTEWWRSSKRTGGLMIPLWGNHMIDYILFMFGETPQRVYCEALTNSDQWQGEDEAIILLGFSKKRFATVRMSWNTKLTEEKEWRGENKILSSKDVLYERYIQGSNGTIKLDDETRLTLNGVLITDDLQVPSNFARQYEEFASAIAEERTPMTDGERGVDLIRIQEAALESARTHQVVYL